SAVRGHGTERRGDEIVHRLTGRHHPSGRLLGAGSATVGGPHTGTCSARTCLDSQLARSPCRPATRARPVRRRPRAGARCGAGSSVEVEGDLWVACRSTERRGTAAWAHGARAAWL